MFALRNLNGAQVPTQIRRLDFRTAVVLTDVSKTATKGTVFNLNQARFARLFSGKQVQRRAFVFSR